MTIDQLQRCTVRIYNTDGDTVGTGFLISNDGLIVTCAHVVEKAGALSGTRLTIAFTLTNDRYSANVVPDGLRSSDKEDIAILRLRGELPTAVTPAILGPSDDTAGHRFRAFGYPKMGDIQGVWAEGKILGSITNSQGTKMLQVESQQVAQGMSGGPVFDLDGKRVVGMITATYHPDDTLKFRDAAFATPVESIVKIWPSLQLRPPIASRKSYDPTYNLTIQHILERTPLSYRVRIERLIEHYTPIFGGRQTELAELDAWFNNKEQPFAFLMAPAGRGKTALLVHWLRHLKKENQNTINIVFHPISLRFETATDEVTFRSLTYQLALLHNEQPPHSQTPAEKLKDLFADYLHRDLPGGKQLLVIIDALDEASQWQVAPNLFPRKPPQGVKILCSARELVKKSLDDWLLTLDWPKLSTRTWLTLPSLNREAVLDTLQAMGDPLASWSDDIDWVSHLQLVSQGDPLTLRLYIEALKDNKLSSDQLTQQPPGLDAYLTLWGEQLELAGEANDATWDMLGCCTVALGPLSEEDLAELCPQTLGRRLRLTAKRVERFIIGNGTPENGYVFSHPRLAEAFAKRLRVEQNQYEQRFIVYGQRTLAHLKTKQLEPRTVSPYLLQSYGMHLTAAGLIDEIPDLICYEWMKAWEWFEGGYIGFLKDIDRAWELAINQRDFSAQTRYALIKASINSIAANIPSELLVRGVEEKIISIPQALSYIEQIEDKEERQSVLYRLETYVSPHLAKAFQIKENPRKKTEWEIRAAKRAEILKEKTTNLSYEFLEEELDFLEETVENITNNPWTTGKYVDETTRRNIVELFTDISPHLTTDLFNRGLEITFKLDFQTRSAILEIFTPRLSSTDSEILWSHCINLKTSLDVTDQENRLRLIVSLIPHLPSNSIPLALRAAWASAQEILSLLDVKFELPGYEIVENKRRSDAIINNICTLISYQPQDLLPKFFKLMKSLSYEDIPVTILVKTAKYLTTPELQEIALSAVKKVFYYLNQRTAWENVLPALNETLRIREFQAAMEPINNPRNDGHRQANTLSILAPHLPPELKIQAVDRVIELLPKVDFNEEKFWVLTKLAPSLSEDSIPSLLQAIYSIQDKFTEREAINILTPYLSKQWLQQILIGLRKVNDEMDIVREGSLFQIFGSGYLSSEFNEASMKRVLTIARNISDETKKSETLGNLMRYVPSSLQLYAIECIESISFLPYQALPFLDLISHLTPDLQLDVQRKTLNSIRVIPYENVRAYNYKLLAENLSPLLVNEVWGDVCKLQESSHRALASSAIVFYFYYLLEFKVFQVVESIFEDINKITKPGDKVMPLVHLAQFLGEQDLLNTIRIIFNHEDIYLDSFTSKLKKILPDLMPCLTTDLLINQIIHEANSISNTEKRNQVLRLLLPYLSTHLKQQIESQIPPMSPPYDYVPPLTAEELENLAKEIKSALHQTEDYSQREAKLRQLISPPNRLAFIPETVTPAELGSIFTFILQEMANRSRTNFLSGVSSYISLIRALDDEKIPRAIIQSTFEIIEWWP